MSYQAGDFVRVTDSDKRAELVGKTGVIVRLIPTNKAYVAMVHATVALAKASELVLVDLDNLMAPLVSVHFSDPGSGAKDVAVRSWPEVETALEAHSKTHCFAYVTAQGQQRIAVGTREPGDPWMIMKRFRAE